MLELGLKFTLAYCLGSIMGALVVGRLRGGIDIRQQGSGNAGGTNALRTQGPVFAAGVLLIAGTDGTTTGVFPGEGIHRELELLVAAGLTPLEAISAATKNAAVLMRDEDEWGTLEVGKRADILIVDGRPDENISETRNIVTVIQRGQVVDRNLLRYDVATDPGFRPLDSF